LIGGENGDALELLQTMFALQPELPAPGTISLDQESLQSSANELDLNVYEEIG